MSDGEAATDGLLIVRATVNLAGLRAGETALVDPRQPYIASCLARELIVPVDDKSSEDGEPAK